MINFQNLWRGELKNLNFWKAIVMRWLNQIWKNSYFLWLKIKKMFICQNLLENRNWKQRKCFLKIGRLLFVKLHSNTLTRSWVDVMKMAKNIILIYNCWPSFLKNLKEQRLYLMRMNLLTTTSNSRIYQKLTWQIQNKIVLIHKNQVVFEGWWQSV